MDSTFAIAVSLCPARQRRRLLSEEAASDDRTVPTSRIRAAEIIAADCLARGFEVLTFDDPDYPPALRLLVDAPPVLYLAGNRALLSHSLRVAVVGSRRGTLRGRLAAETLGRQLARSGVCVVSGLALGIDAESHRGALAVGGDCIGVVATGLDEAHPASHRSLHEEVIRRGLLLSEYPPGSAARKYTFVARNRILAALARAVVVVEASARSGALSTVDFALQMGHEVHCFPAPVDCSASQGCLQLLRDGATLVRHAADVLESLGVRGSEVESDPSGLGMGGRAERAEEIARRQGRPLPEVLADLEDLLDQGRVRRVAGGRWQVTS